MVRGQRGRLVGLPETEVKEAKDRVRAALQNARFEFPARRITVNLAPADLPKEGSQFDLPILLAMMVAMEAVAPDAVAGYAAIGELALDGSIRAVPGALPAAIGANAMGKPNHAGSYLVQDDDEAQRLVPLRLAA